MDYSQIKEIIKNEYQKLCNNPNVNKTVIQHPQFYQVFESIFIQGIDLRQNYKVEATGNSIVISSSVNYPEATNGIYKGYESAQKHIIEIDKEHLAVKEENSYIFKYPNKENNGLSYTSKVTAYDNEKEVGYTTFSRQEEVNKNYQAAYAFYNTAAQPELSTGYALNGTACEPRQSDIYCKYRSEGCRRYNGLATKEVINRTDRTTKEHWVTYGGIHTEYPERLSNNVSDFAIRKFNEGEWKKMDGNPLSEEELNQTIAEYRQYSTMTQSGNSR